MTDEAKAFGQKVALLRKRRGLSQREFAALISRSEAWVSQVERGARRIDRMSVLESLANALGVPLSEIAPEKPVVAAQHERPAPAVDLTLALSSSTALAAVFGERASSGMTELTEATEQAWSFVHAAEYQRVSDLMVQLLPELEFAARSAEGDTQRAIYAALARAYHACASVLTKLGEPAGAWVSADRAIAAAERSGDALLMAEGAFRLTLVFQGSRQFAQVVSTASTAIRALAGKVETGDPAAISLAGALHLQLAVAAARRNEHQVAYDELAAADDLAERLGFDRNDYGTEFGPTNVRLHYASVAVELGDAGRAIQVGEELDASDLSPERRARLLVELARAHAQRRDVDRAVACIDEAFSIAPEQISGHPVVHALVRDLQHVGGGNRAALTALMGRLGI